MRNNLLYFLSFLLLFACSNGTELKFNGSDISEARLNATFDLTSHLGTATRLEDFKGKVVAIFFGFTHCPDVCPTTMNALKSVKQALGADKDRLQVIFVSLDPERDNIELLAKFIPSFDPSFIGLTGSPESLKKVAGQYKIFYQKVGNQENYTIDHSSAIYLIDKTGAIRIRHPFGSTEEMIVKDIKKLLSI